MASLSNDSFSVFTSIDGGIASSLAVIVSFWVSSHDVSHVGLLLLLANHNKRDIHFFFFKGPVLLQESSRIGTSCPRQTTILTFWNLWCSFLPSEFDYHCTAHCLLHPRGLLCCCCTRHGCLHQFSRTYFRRQYWEHCLWWKFQIPHDLCFARV